MMGRTSRMGRLFEAICEGGMNRRRHERVMEYLRSWMKPGDDILEVGCDDGAYALSFAMMGLEVTALDPIRTPFMAHLYD